MKLVCQGCGSDFIKTYSFGNWCEHCGTLEVLPGDDEEGGVYVSALQMPACVEFRKEQEREARYERRVKGDLDRKAHIVKSVLPIIARIASGGIPPTTEELRVLMQGLGG